MLTFAIAMLVFCAPVLIIFIFEVFNDKFDDTN